MTTVSIPLVATPAQTLTVSLGSQNARIDIAQKSTGLYISVYLDAGAVQTPIVTGCICRNLVKIVRGPSLIGDLYFYDTQGSDDPYYTGLDGRFLLVYDDAA